jgi:formamidopyrimidine-DNA glycosylase
MPELPEVETIRRDLSAKIIDKKIKNICIGKKRIVKNSSQKFIKTLTGNKFIKIDRMGKLLIIGLQDNKQYLLVHLKMTGQLIYCYKGKYVAGGHSLPKIGDSLPNKYSHVIFSFADGSRLFFNDLRQFGYLEIVDAKKLKKVKSKFGIEPLTNNFKLENFKVILKKRTAPIKAVLLNQQLVAGIGNIYADEILFAAKILPTRPANSLRDNEIKNIYLAAEKIIKTAIKYRGTTFNDYVDAQGNVGSFVKHLKVYGRAGKKCLRCGGIIKKIKLGGRGTHFCSECQK